MKREFLKSIEGLTDEAIDKIIAENGKDIEATKVKTGQATEKVTQELENLKSELESNKQTLEQANAQIEKFKGLDVEGVKAQAEEWKNKYSELENNAKAEREANEKQLADQQYDFKVNEYVSGQKFTSEFTKKAYMAELKAQGFKLDKDGSLLGANEYTEKFKTENQGVFMAEETQAPLPQFTQQAQQPPKVEMSLMEKMRLANLQK